MVPGSRAWVHRYPAANAVQAVAALPALPVPVVPVHRRLHEFAREVVRALPASAAKRMMLSVPAHAVVPAHRYWLPGYVREVFRALPASAAIRLQLPVPA